MKTVVGIFRTRKLAEHAAEALRAAGLPAAKIHLLTPEDSPSALETIPTSETEQPGMGKAVGGVVGGVFGATTGLGLGAAAASLLIPGVGPVAGAGLLAAALLGAGGAVGGAAAGGALEDAMSQGLPKDELYLYEDALRKGHSLVAVLVEETDEERARAILASNGAESLDAAREEWWIGLRPVEESEYDDPHASFGKVESVFRRGFEAAFRSDLLGRRFEEVSARLRDDYGEAASQQPFRRGFDRGQRHWESLHKPSETAEAAPRA